MIWISQRHTHHRSLYLLDHHHQPTTQLPNPPIHSLSTSIHITSTIPITQPLERSCERLQHVLGRSSVRFRRITNSRSPSLSSSAKASASNGDLMIQRHLIQIGDQLFYPNPRSTMPKSKHILRTAHISMTPHVAISAVVDVRILSCRMLLILLTHHTRQRTQPRQRTPHTV